MSAPEPPSDLIDSEGGLWQWGHDGDREGYMHRELFCAWQRHDIEREFGECREVSR